MKPGKDLLDGIIDLSQCQQKEPKNSKPLSKVERRAIDTGTAIVMNPPEQIAYQHTVLCQTSMPYRNPGQNIRVWDREQGVVSLRINAGDAKNPETGEWV